MEGGGEPNLESSMSKQLYVRNALFTGAQPIDLNACVGTNGGPYNLIDYARGYARATARLTESLKADSLWVDVVVYPLVFNARHASELYLKHHVHLLPHLYDEKLKPKGTHRLLDNWKLVRSLVERGAELDDENPLDPTGDLAVETDRVLQDLVEVDPSGEAFRFPWARDQSRFLQDTNIINVRVFESAMQLLFEAFEYWDDIAFRILDAREDYA